MINLAVMYTLLIPCVFAYFYFKKEYGERKSLIFKAICTSIILMTAIAGLYSAPSEIHIFAALIAAGLAFGLAGDVSISYNFISGMLLFGIGHFCYIAAMLRISRNVFLIIPAFLVLYAIVIFLYRITRIQVKELLIPGIIYSIIIIIMLGAAVTMPASVSSGGFILFAGAVLFTISDTMLAWNIVKTPSKKTDYISLICYYLGQSLFAVSIYCISY